MRAFAIIWLVGCGGDAVAVTDWIVAGQSNALGTGTVITPPALQSGGELWHFVRDPPGAGGAISEDDDAWGDPIEPRSNGRFGVEMGMATQIANMRALKCAQGSSSIDTEWRNGTPKRLDELIAEMGEAAFSPPWMLWLQGGTDVGMSAATYETHLEALIASVRAAGDPNMFVFLATDPNALGGTVETAQRKVANEDARAFWVDTSDLPVEEDAIHYTQGALVTLGQRLITLAQMQESGQLDLTWSRSGALTVATFSPSWGN